MTPNKITNPSYRKFLDDGIIDVIEEEQIVEALKNIKGKHIQEGQALLIFLYYTGARPAEALQTQAKHITREKTHILVRVGGGIKKSLPRTVHLPYKLPLAKQLYQYSTGMFREMFLFHNYKGSYRRVTKTSKGEIVTRTETTDKLRHHLKKWFQGVIPGSITPYYLRHNRFSKLAIAGVSDRDLRQLKGSRTNDSIIPYLHMSTASSKNVAKVIK